MWGYLSELWTDKMAFKQAVRGVLLAAAVGMSTAAGAEVLRDLGADSPYVRLVLVMLSGGTAGAIRVGEKNLPIVPPRD